jgi:Peptidase A4 family
MSAGRKRARRPRLEQFEDRCLLTGAVLDILNQTAQTMFFNFRWSPFAPWSQATEAPGQDRMFVSTYSSGLTPQIAYSKTTAIGSLTMRSLTQGYGQWPGPGTPPASVSDRYTFLDTSAGNVNLYFYGNSAPTTPPTNPNPVSSGNWSGYAAATSLSNPAPDSVTYIQGTWIVPAVTGPADAATDSSIWVGIDGYGNGTVEQTGTQQAVVDGVPVYRAWWEMYSVIDKQDQQTITSMTVMPGDSITASVQFMTNGPMAGLFRLSITDNSRPNDSFTTYQTSQETQSPLAARSTAEWIVEAPTVSGAIASVPNFGSVPFTGASAVINGISGPINSSSWQSTAIVLAQDGVIYDSTSVLTSSGSSFVVTYNPSATDAVSSSTNLGGQSQSSAVVGTGIQPTHKNAKTVTVAPAWAAASRSGSPIRQPKAPAQRLSIGQLLGSVT